MTEFVDEYREARNRGIERTVLVVDDEPVNREMLGLIVGKEYRVLYAENGKEALEIIKENRNTLSLVLLDFLMPVMNGFELLEAMKKNSMLSHIPVIVLTSDKGSEIRSFRLGAVDFLTKPYDMPEVILARVRRTIEFFEDSIVIKATEKDTLTGLYTREYFFIYGKRYDLYHPDREMDAVVVDISHFHLINELYGVEEGNRILRNMADRIRRILDEQGGYACRKEADTFYLYLGHREDYETVRKKITEDLSEKCGDLELRIRIVEKHQSDGFRIEMDDFGTGYSSLNVLASMPIDALKLDMKFIRNIEERGKDYHIVRLVIEMAGYLSVPVIAEGVENEEQCRILKEAGCAVVQGYCFSRPVPPEEFEKYLGTAV